MGYETMESKMKFYNGSGYMFYDDEKIDFTARGQNAEKLFAERASKIIQNHAALQNQQQTPLFLYVSTVIFIYLLSPSSFLF